MSAIIRVTDIGRPGQITYANPLNTWMTSPFDRFIESVFHGAGPTPERSVTGGTWTTVDSGSFTIPSSTRFGPATSTYHLFMYKIDMKTGGDRTAGTRTTIDGVTHMITTLSTSYVTFYRAYAKIPSSTTISWSLELRGSDIGPTTGYCKDLIIVYTPVWTQDILYAKDIGANVLLTRVTLSPYSTIEIDDDYVYHNPTSSFVVVDFNLLPFHKIKFSGPSSGTLIRVEYLRVE